jgi:hypothetical protein
MQDIERSYATSTLFTFGKEGDYKVPHHYVNILELIRMYLAKDWSISIHHILRDGNSCVDILAKMGANSSDHFVTFNEPLHCLTLALLDYTLDVSF